MKEKTINFPTISVKHTLAAGLDFFSVIVTENAEIEVKTFTAFNDALSFINSIYSTRMIKGFDLVAGDAIDFPNSKGGGSDDCITGINEILEHWSYLRKEINYYV